MKKYFAMSIFIFGLHHALFSRLVFLCTAILRDLVSFFLRHLKIDISRFQYTDPRNNFFRAFYLQYGIFLNRVNFRRSHTVEKLQSWASSIDKGLRFSYTYLVHAIYKGRQFIRARDVARVFLLRA